jgi:O-succinylbenzoic acid--CoA ligase
VEPWLQRSAARAGERAALDGPSGPIGYPALLDRAREVAGGLVAAGVGPGDRVALRLASEPLVVALHACLLIGAVAVPIDLRLSAEEQAPRLAAASIVLDELPGAAPLDPGAVRAPDPAAAATLMFTSGTTGGPKPVVLTIGNWLWNAMGSALALGLDPEERWLCPMPLAHVGGLSIQIRSAIYGTTVLLHERFDTERVLAALNDAQARVTLVSLVPTMLARLLEAGLRAPPTLRRVLLGGGPIAPSLLARAREAGVPVAPSYGMTETCSQAVTDGIPLIGVQLRIAGDGEILVRGATVAPGALADDGWLHTGDLGELDGAGRLSVIGRRSDTIITGGENVAPVEVEQVLLEHPAVADAAVFGRADPEWGEAVVAHVVPAAGAAVEAAELRAHLSRRLASFKVPKRIELVDSVPRGVTGKLLRRELA